MFQPGEIISHYEMSGEEGATLQRGMNYRLGGYYSVLLMSVRRGAPYSDKVEEDGQVLIYEGHDVAKSAEIPNPKMVDQPMFNKSESLTQNGLFYEAAIEYNKGKRDSEKVRVYEKIQSGIWVYNGLFNLIDSWIEDTGLRKVFKYRLVIREDQELQATDSDFDEMENSRIIPSSVKLEVWKRDEGKCVKCGSMNRSGVAGE